MTFFFSSLKTSTFKEIEWSSGNNSLPGSFLEQGSSKQQSSVSVAMFVLFIVVAKGKMKMSLLSEKIFFPVEVLKKSRLDLAFCTEQLKVLCKKFA